jgi:hypothetical protein
MAYQLETWTAHPSWPADGVEIATTGGVVSTYRPGKVIVANGSRLAVLAHNVTVGATPVATVVSIINKATGAITAAGSGDAAAGGISIPEIVSDGTNLFFSVYTGAGAFVLASCTIANPQLGCGGTGYPNALLYSGDDYRLGICGSMAITAHVDAALAANDIIIQNHRSSRADIDGLWCGESSFSASPLIGKSWNQGSALCLCSDGINIWIMSKLEGQKGGCRVTKYDLGKFHTHVSSVATYRQASDLAAKSYILGNLDVSVVNPLQCSMVFDGRDIWCIPESTHGTNGSGYIFRLPLALLRG